MKLKIKKLRETAKIPTKAHATDAGIDLYSAETKAIMCSDRYLISTGISMKIPKGYYGQIVDRSGNAYKKGMHIMAGVIDEDYRGEVKVLVYNTRGSQPVFVEEGDKIAQMVLLPVPQVEIEEVDELDDTERGDGGFGSTGK